MAVESPRYENPLHEEFFRAAQAAGLAANDDFNDWSHGQEGYGEYQVTRPPGCSTLLGSVWLPAQRCGCLAAPWLPGCLPAWTLGRGRLPAWLALPCTVRCLGVGVLGLQRWGRAGG